jgi:hypothetical protein
MYHDLRNNIKTKSGALRNSVVIVWKYTHSSTRAAISVRIHGYFNLNRRSGKNGAVPLFPARHILQISEVLQPRTVKAFVVVVIRRNPEE